MELLEDVKLVVPGDVDIQLEAIMTREIPMLNGGKCLLSREIMRLKRKFHGGETTL